MASRFLSNLVVIPGVPAPKGTEFYLTFSKEHGLRLHQVKRRFRVFYHVLGTAKVLNGKYTHTEDLIEAAKYLRYMEGKRNV